MADTLPIDPEVAGPLPTPVFHDPKHHLKIYQGDCLEVLAAIPADCVDLIFADPPYFLSNDGITCHAGKMVSGNVDLHSSPFCTGSCGSRSGDILYLGLMRWPFSVDFIFWQ
jgi:hypothetical protein